MKSHVNWNLIRILIIISGSLFGLLGLFFGFILVLKGATGKFEVLGEGKGISIFVTALSPGLFFVLASVIVNSISIIVQKKSLGLPSHRELKARGGVDYYKVKAGNGRSQSR